MAGERPQARRAFAWLLAAGMLFSAVTATSALGHSLYPGVQAIVSRPGETKGDWLMAATFGMLRTTDGGDTANWICEEAYVADTGSIDATVAVLSDGTWLVTTDGHAFTSTDDGCNWSKLEGVPEDTWFYGIWQDEGALDALWAVAVVGGKTHHLMRRDPKTGKWTSKWSSGPLHVKRLVLRGQRLAALAADPAGAGALLLWSEDGGQTITSKAIKNIQGELWLAPLHPTRPELLVLRANKSEEYRIWRSTNGGETWQQALKLKLKQDLQTATWLADEATPTLLVAGLVGGLWRSTDSGESFKKVKDAPQIGCFVHPDGLLLACTNNYYDLASLMRSDDGGQTWAPLSCFNKIGGPLTCASESAVAGLCPAGWPQLAEQKSFYPGLACDQRGPPPDAGAVDDASDASDAADAAPGPDTGGDPPSDSCCAGWTGRSGALPGLLLLSMAVLMVLRRRSQGGATSG